MYVTFISISREQRNTQSLVVDVKGICKLHRVTCRRLKSFLNSGRGRGVEEMCFTNKAASSLVVNEMSTYHDLTSLD